MAVQKGRELIIQVEDSPSAGTYTTVAGGRSKNFNPAFPSTDVSHADSPGQWQERASGFSLKALQFSMNGLWKNHATQRKVFNAMWNGTGPLNYKVVVPGLGVFIGPFTVDSLPLSGDHTNELSFSAQFDSAGEIAYTPSA